MESYCRDDAGAGVGNGAVSWEFHSVLGLWARCDDRHIVFGLDDPGSFLPSRLSDSPRLVADGQTVRRGDDLFLSVGRYVLKVQSPSGGTIHFNPESRLESTPAMSPGWLFRLCPDDEVVEVFQEFVELLGHVESLNTCLGRFRGH